MQIFISYSTADQQSAESLARALGSCGVESFLAQWSLRPGAFWMPELGRAINEADAFLLIVGPSGPGPWQLLEYYEAFERKARTPSFPLIPVLLPHAQPRLPFLRQLQWHDYPQVSSPDSITALMRALENGASAPPGDPWRRTNPYKGLSALEEADSDFFFGREQLTTSVITQLRDGARFIALVGVSGVGKSSLQQAGVVASLRRQRWPDDAERSWPHDLVRSKRWAYLSVRPETQPLRALAKSIVANWTRPNDPGRREQIDTWTKKLAAGLGLDALLDAWRDVCREQFQTDPPDRFVIILNQTEELYKRDTSDEELRPFASTDAKRLSAILGAAVERPDVVVIASLRSDRYDAFQSDHDLFSRSVRIDVPPLWGNEAIRPVVERPAQLLQVSFDPPTMPGDIAEDVQRAPGALPFLSYILEDVWKRMQARGDARLSWSDYVERGRVSGVLRTRFEEYLETTKDDQREALRRLFTLRLSHVERDKMPSRRIATKGECSDREWAHVERLASEDWRLLVVANQQGEGTAEVGHECVLTADGPINEWIGGDRPFLEWKARLEAERRFWETEGRHDAELLPGARLQAFVQRLGDRRDDLAPDDRMFLNASERLQREAAEQEQRDRALVARSHRLDRSLRRAVVSAITLATLAVGAYLIVPRVESYNIWRVKRLGSQIATASQAWVVGLVLVGDDPDRVNAAVHQFVGLTESVQIVEPIPQILRTLGRTAEAKKYLSLISAQGFDEAEIALQLASLDDVNTAETLVRSLNGIQERIALADLLSRRPEYAQNARQLLTEADRLIENLKTSPLPSGGDQTRQLALEEWWARMMWVYASLDDPGKAVALAGRLERTSLERVVDPDTNLFLIVPAPFDMTSKQRLTLVRALTVQLRKLIEVSTDPDSLATAGRELARAGERADATNALTKAWKIVQPRIDAGDSFVSVSRITAEGWTLLHEQEPVDAILRHFEGNGHRNIERQVALTLAVQGDFDQAFERLKKPGVGTPNILTRAAKFLFRENRPDDLKRLVRGWLDAKLEFDDELIGIARMLAEVGDKATAQRLLRDNLFDADGHVHNFVLEDTEVVATIDPALARRVLDASLAEAVDSSVSDEDRYNRAMRTSQIAKQLARVGQVTMTQSLLAEVLSDLQPLQTDAQWTIRGRVAEAYAAGHLYREARLTVDECAPDIRLRAYAAILLEYANQQDARVDPLLADVWKGLWVPIGK